MKRSEMVTLIDKEISNRKSMDEEIIGEDILSVIEKLGMKLVEIKEKEIHIGFEDES